MKTRDWRVPQLEILLFPAAGSLRWSVYQIATHTRVWTFHRPGPLQRVLWHPTPANVLNPFLPKFEGSMSTLSGKRTLIVGMWDSLIDQGFPHSSAGKESACNAGDPGSIPGLARSPGEGIGYPLQYSCLENSIQSMGMQRVGHDWMTFTFTIAIISYKGFWK